MINAVKWIRKNERKLMTALLVFIMIAFVGGAAVKQILSARQGFKDVVAHYDDGIKLRRDDFARANTELKILEALTVPQQLQFRSSPLTGGPSIGAWLLGQLLFSDSQSSAYINGQMKQMLAEGKLAVDEAVIDEFFIQAGASPGLHWLLLREEAKSAGWAVSTEDAKTELKNAIKGITRGQNTAAQLVDRVMKELAVPEDVMIRIYADYLAVLSYAQQATAGQNISTAQLEAMTARATEKISAEFVKIAADSFTDVVEEPTEDELSAQFDAYKDTLAGTKSDDNPLGFGYKLDDRARVEYIIIKINDIKKTIEKPTAEDKEEFYRNNVDRHAYASIFKYTEKADADDPESEDIQKTRKYSEVEKRIDQRIITERTSRKADMIINEARDLTEEKQLSLDMYEATTDEIRNAAGSYSDAAKALKEKYNIEVYTGTSGMLSLEEFSSAKNLGRLSMLGASYRTVKLSKIAFAVKELEATKLGRFDVSTPRMWENIAPMRDMFNEYGGNLIAMARVVEVAKAAAPESIDISYSTKAAEIDAAKVEEQTVSIRMQVSEDVKLQKSMAMAAERAAELKKLVSEKGWDPAIEEYNKKYESQTKLELAKLTDKARLSYTETKRAEIMFGKTSFGKSMLQTRGAENDLLDDLYALIPFGENEVKNSMATIASNPNLASYLVKDVSYQPASMDDFLAQKSQIAMSVSLMDADRLSFIHYMPENIRKRTNFKAVKVEEEEDTETDSDEKTDGAA